MAKAATAGDIFKNTFKDFPVAAAVGNAAAIKSCHYFDFLNPGISMLLGCGNPFNVNCFWL